MRTCSFCGEQTPKNSNDCIICGEKESQKPLLKRTSISVSVQAVRKRILSSILLGLTLDRTGSSSAFSSVILNYIETLFNLLEKEFPNLKIWFQSHGDRDYGELEIMHCVGGEVTEAISASKELVGKFSGGGDPEESHNSAFLQLFRSIPDWQIRKDAVKIAVLIVNAETKDSKELTTEQLAQKYNDAGVLVYMLCQKTPKLMAFANLTNAYVLEIANSPKEEDLLAAVQKISKSITASVSRGATKPVMHN